jgi:hypothetical protein
MDNAPDRGGAGHTRDNLVPDSRVLMFRLLSLRPGSDEITIHCILWAQGNVGARSTNWPSFTALLCCSCTDIEPFSAATSLTRNDNDRLSIA